MLKGWKTLIFGAAVTLLGVVPDLIPALEALLPQWMATKGTALIGILIIVLRAITTTPVLSSEPKDGDV